MAKVVVSPWGAASKHKYAASEEGKEEQAPSDGGALKPSAELIAEVERVRVRLKNSGDRWVLDPSTKHYRRWDFMTFTALVFTAVVTPVEVGFFTDIRFDALFFVNRFVDAVFISDIFIQFVLAYPDPNRGNILIKSSPMIVKRYLRTWFFIDFVSSVPFDALAMIPSATFLSQFKPLRLVRLLKLARVAKLKRILARWEAYAVFAVSYATLSVLKLSAMLAVFAHWSACLWGLAANPSFVGEDAWSWIRKRRRYMVDDLGKPTFRAGNAFHKYAASLYFSIYTMIGLGYGDVTATTHSETIVVVLIMVSSAIFWAFMIGNFCNVVQTMDAQETSYRQRMDDLNYMMEDRKFPLGLRNRCRMYLVNSKEHQRTAGYGRIEDLFSTELKGEVAATNNERWLKSIWYMSDLSYDFVIELSHNIDSMMFAPAEPINVLDSLFIIQSGIAARKGRVLPKGSVWGCDFILEDANLIDRVCAAALSYASVAYLTRDDVFQILAEPSFGDERRAVARASRFYRLKALLIVAAQEILSDQGITRKRRGYALGTTAVARRSTVQIGTKTIKKAERPINSQRMSMRFSETDGAVQMHLPAALPPPLGGSPSPGDDRRRPSPHQGSPFCRDSAASLSSTPAASPRRASLDAAPPASAPAEDVRRLQASVDRLEGLVRRALARDDDDSPPPRAKRRSKARLEAQADARLALGGRDEPPPAAAHRRERPPSRDGGWGGPSQRRRSSTRKMSTEESAAIQALIFDKDREARKSGARLDAVDPADFPAEPIGEETAVEEL